MLRYPGYGYDLPDPWGILLSGPVGQQGIWLDIPEWWVGGLHSTETIHRRRDLPIWVVSQWVVENYADLDESYELPTAPAAPQMPLQDAAVAAWERRVERAMVHRAIQLALRCSADVTQLVLEFWR